MIKTLETADGIRYNIEHCIKGMNKFNKNSQEYKIFQKTFEWICRKASRENFSDSQLV